MPTSPRSALAGFAATVRLMAHNAVKVTVIRQTASGHHDRAVATHHVPRVEWERELRPMWQRGAAMLGAPFVETVRGLPSLAAPSDTRRP